MRRRGTYRLRGTRRRSLAIALALPVLLLSTVDCERKGLAPARRVILLGVDGADWTVIDRLTEEGRLPSFARMRAEGVSGPLQSREPLFSPILWATISTGKLPEKHGIRSFTVKLDDRPVPVTSNLCRAQRIWEILSRAGRTVGVIGWWTTWPAAPVNGFLCSERTWPLTMGEHGWPITTSRATAISKRTYPEALGAEIDPLIVTRSNLTASDLRLVDVSGVLGTAGTQGPSVADIYAKDITFRRFAEALYPRHRPDFFTLYLELPDAMAHYFWDFWRYYRFVRFGEETVFDEPPQGVSPELAAGIGRNYEGSYVFVDGVLGDLLAAAEESTLVVVVSDHGYGENPTGRRLHIGDGLYARNPHWHLPDGILLAWGYGVPAGRSVTGAAVSDVAPTLLYALGEPVGEDMDGRVLREIFLPDFARRELRTVGTHEPPGTPVDREPLPSPDDEHHIEMLRSLGYIK